MSAIIYNVVYMDDLNRPKAAPFTSYAKASNWAQRVVGSNYQIEEVILDPTCSELPKAYLVQIDRNFDIIHVKPLYEDTFERPGVEFTAQIWFVKNALHVTTVTPNEDVAIDAAERAFNVIDSEKRWPKASCFQFDPNTYEPIGHPWKSA